MHTCFHPDLHPGVLELTEEEALHVVRVLRMKEGESVRLMDGMGGVATGELVQVGKRQASVHVEEVSRSEKRPSGLSLVVAPTKHTDRFEWLIEKATELGVREIVPVWTRRSERRTDKHVRWSKVVVSATKQCQRPWMPLLHEACPLGEVFERHPHLKEIQGAVAHCDDALTSVPARAGQTGSHGRLACCGAGRGFLGRRSGMVARSRSDACPPRRPALEDRNGGHGRRGSIHHESVPTE